MSAMGASPAKPLNPLRWLGIPTLYCVLGSLLLAIPLRLFGLHLPNPVFAFVPAFAWAVIRPSILPPFVLLLLGLFLDIFWDGPKGLWPLCLLISYAAVLTARRLIMGQDLLIVWAWYAALTALSFLVGYSVISADGGAAPNLLSVIWQYLVTAALYPFAHRLIARYEDADVRFR